MHSNHKLELDALSNAVLQHYNLDMAIGSKLQTQCFFNDKDEITHITWKGMIIEPGKPFWRDIAALVQSSINQDSLSMDMVKLAKVSDYKAIQAMHNLAEKFCAGFDISC